SVTKSVIPPNGFAASPRGDVRARSRMWVAWRAFVFQTLRPSTTQRSPLRSARVWMREVSVPAFGSVTPKDMTISPVAIRGRYLRLSASEPCLITGIGGNREKWMGEAPEGPGPGAQTSWSMIVAPGGPRPGAADG